MIQGHFWHLNVTRTDKVSCGRIHDFDQARRLFKIAVIHSDVDCYAVNNGTDSVDDGDAVARVFIAV